jgi:hypothetical protein
LVQFQPWLHVASLLPTAETNFFRIFCQMLISTVVLDVISAFAPSFPVSPGLS